MKEEIKQGNWKKKKKKVKLYLVFLFLCLELISSLWIIRDVEWMVACWRVGVEATLDDKVVGLTPHHVDLGNEKPVDVPGNAPSDVTCRKRIF